MRLENAVAADVLERILSAYGFTMQKELSDKLGIAKSNVASWLQRGQVPGNVLVQCALDTGTDVRWLVTGEFANAKMGLSHEPPKNSLLNGQSLISKMLRSGGKPVLQRILEAYGFKTQKELSEYLGISTGTISTWVRREYFPGDVVIACALNTGASLEWLATGSNIKITKNTNFAQTENQIIVKKKNLISGKLEESGDLILDDFFIPHSINIDKVVCVCSGLKSWLISTDCVEVVNGIILLEIDGVLDIYDVSRRPGNKLFLSAVTGSFECSVSDVKAVGLAFLVIDFKV